MIFLKHSRIIKRIVLIVHACKYMPRGVAKSVLIILFVVFAKGINPTEILERKPECAALVI